VHSKYDATLPWDFPEMGNACAYRMSVDGWLLLRCYNLIPFAHANRVRLEEIQRNQ